MYPVWGRARGARVSPQAAGSHGHVAAKKIYSRGNGTCDVIVKVCSGLGPGPPTRRAHSHEDSTHINALQPPRSGGVVASRSRHKGDAVADGGGEHLEQDGKSHTHSAVTCMFLMCVHVWRLCVRASLSVIVRGGTSVKTSGVSAGGSVCLVCVGACGVWVSVCPERPRVSAGTTGPPRVSLCHVEVGGCEGRGSAGGSGYQRKSVRRAPPKVSEAKGCGRTRHSPRTSCRLAGARPGRVSCAASAYTSRERDTEVDRPDTESSWHQILRGTIARRLRSRRPWSSRRTRHARLRSTSCASPSKLAMMVTPFKTFGRAASSLR